MTLSRGGFEVFPDMRVPPNNQIPNWSNPRRASGAHRQCEAGTVDDAAQDGREFGRATRLHARNFVDCIKSRQRPIADVEQGHRCRPPATWRTSRCAWAAGIRWDPERPQSSVTKRLTPCWSGHIANLGIRCSGAPYDAQRFSRSRSRHSGGNGQCADRPLRDGSFAGLLRHRAALPRVAIDYLEYAHARGAGGVQVAVNPADSEAIRKLRARAEEFGMYLEVTTCCPRPTTRHSSSSRESGQGGRRPTACGRCA